MIKFPLQQEMHEIPLENLSEGWYVVCGEAVKSNVVLERECFKARVFRVPDQDSSKRRNHKYYFSYIVNNIFNFLGLLHVGVIIVIALVGVVLLLIFLYAIHVKIHRDRRKRIDQ